MVTLSMEVNAGLMPVGATRVFICYQLGSVHKKRKKGVTFSTAT